MEAPAKTGGTGPTADGRIDVLIGKTPAIGTGDTGQETPAVITDDADVLYWHRQTPAITPAVPGQEL